MNVRGFKPRVLATVIAAVALASVGVAGQSRTGTGVAPRTPWGDPDLQGVWNNNTVVPLERPEALADKEVLTDDEVAARFQQTSESTFSQREGDPGFYNEFWWEYGQDTNRTSLVVDPPNGQLPPLTPEGQARADAGAHRFPRWA